MTEPEKKETLLEQAIRIKAERRAQDPMLNYAPGISQNRCLLSTKMLRLLQGPNRSGKTAHAIAEIVMAARRIHPTRTVLKPVTYVVWATSREQIRDVLFQKMRVRSELKGPCSEQPMIPDYEVVKDHMVNGAGKPVCREIELKNGNRIMFAISGIERSWIALQGKGHIAGIMLDEQAGTQKLIDECLARLMELNNDENIAEFGGAWFLWSSSETMLSDAWDNLKSICLDPERNKDAEYFHIPAAENIAVSMAARERVGQFMSAEAYKIRVTGEGNARAATLVYGKQWSDARHMLPRDHIPSINANLWASFDPGVDHPTGMGVFCIEPEEPMRLIGVKFWNGKGGTIDTDVMNLAKWLAGRQLAGFVYDTNLKNKDRGGGPSLLAQMQDKMMAAGISPKGGYWQARKQVNAGIQMVRYYLDPAPDNRSVTPFIAINPSEESGGKLMRWQMLKYSGHEEKQFTGAGAIIKKDDELADIIRYLVLQRPAWCKDYRCGQGNTAYVFPTQFPTQVETPAVLSPEEAHMARLMALSKQGAQFRRSKRYRS